jgi:hypothetical protein
MHHGLTSAADSLPRHLRGGADRDDRDHDVASPLGRPTQLSGEPLFASVNKYDSHTGWPSFTVPVEPGHVQSCRGFGFRL